jgi:hypothetical protein
MSKDSEPKKILLPIILSVVGSLLTAAVIYLAVQITKIPLIIETIENLPTTSENLDEHVTGNRKRSSKNDARILMLLLVLKNEGVLNEEDVNFILSSYDSSD